MSDAETFSVRETLRDKRLIAVGATGFLGKVWVSQLLHALPEIAQLYLFVRSKNGQSSEDRFWEELTINPVFDPLREDLGEKKFNELLRERVTPIDGDVSKPLLGTTDLTRKFMSDADVIINAAGLVDFNPPLDEALKVNAFGMQNLVAFARTLGDLPILHTSTCYVAGNRSDLILEEDPRQFPFPKADVLEPSLWDPEREIEESLDLIKQAHTRAEDRFRQSHFLRVATENLTQRHEPASGSALDDELALVKRRFVAKTLREAGRERAEHWGFPNTYTYTKSIGEQVLLSSGLRSTIVRPAVIESSLSYPFPGWCEGINTSAPLIYLAIKGQVQFPMHPTAAIDVIPVDFVARALTVTTAALLRGEHQPVYQVGSSDTNPLPLRRLTELTGLAKRKRMKTAAGNAFWNRIQANIEPVSVTGAQYEKHGAPQIGKALRFTEGLLKRGRATPFSGVARSAERVVGKAARQTEAIAKIFDLFLPFTAENDLRFSTQALRTLIARVQKDEASLVHFAPENLDWRDYLVNIHIPGLEKWSEPLMDKKRAPKRTPKKAYDTLIQLAEETATRYGHAPAFSQLLDKQLARTSYAEVLTQARAGAARLASLGIEKGDRVLLVGANTPEWAIAYFAILFAGGVAVPLDKDLSQRAIDVIAQESGAKLGVFDSNVERPSKLSTLSIADLASADRDTEPPSLHIDGDDLASIIFTSGTTGKPKGVMLSHANFCALLSSVSAVFDLGPHDRVLSVLPLHHTFEFSCGLLLPFSHGAEVIYLTELSAENLVAGLTVGRVTAMIGVPALWQLLERRIQTQVETKGPVTQAAFKALSKINGRLGKTANINLGKIFFQTLHQELGGHVRTLVSGGAALPKETEALFHSLGLPLQQGYGLTEAAPVLTVGRKRPGTGVGRAIPGVELKIDNPNADGIGEVLARGKNVMAGYFNNPEATAEVLVDGWLRTGDLGKLDHKDQLQIVGRIKDVIVTENGENVYPEDIETALILPKQVDELAIVGITADAGSERVGCLAVCAKDTSPKAARAALTELFRGLPRHQRPRVLHVVEAPLPRTATKKVRRQEVQQILERIEDAGRVRSHENGEVTEVRRIVARLTQRAPQEIGASSRLHEDLGLDSLALTELCAALTAESEPLSLSLLTTCETVADIERILAVQPEPAADSDTGDTSPPKVPEVVQRLGKGVLGYAQRELYNTVLKTQVFGRAHIPYDRQVIVIANHSSHLDMGLVKFALGPYGEDLVALAAQDYFFEDRWRQFYFQNFTNVAPLERNGGLKKSLQQASRLIEGGKTLLIFPEGTRSAHGEMQAFKPALGNLVVDHQIDLLPIFLTGTHEALGKGRAVLRGREVAAHIGPMLAHNDLVRLTKDRRGADQYRAITRIAEASVAALRDKTPLTLDELAERANLRRQNPKQKMQSVFTDLEAKFRPETADKNLSFYFSLEGADHSRWTVAVEDRQCQVHPGKPASGVADCVLKTSPEMFERIVRESYTPDVQDFVSGRVKTNDLELLTQFKRIFDL